MSDGELAELIQRYLVQTGQSDAAGIVRGLGALGSATQEPARVIKVLYLHPDLFERVAASSNVSSWRATAARGARPASGAQKGADTVAASRAPTLPTPPVKPPERTEVPSPAPRAPIVDNLYDWQREALDAWRQNDHRGVIEAVTGAGKTRVAVQAIAETLAADPAARALVLVPTMALAAQWLQRLTEANFEGMGVAGATVGMLGGGEQASLSTDRILIATMQSASTRLLLGRSGPSLLVGDEVHRLGAPTWSRALDPAFQRRLGLTATLEREDEGVEELIRPYFGQTVFTLGLARALQDQIVAPFHVTFVAVGLTIAERNRYREATESIRKSMAVFAASGTIPMQPFGAMMRAVQEASMHHGSGLTGPARAYLKAFSERKAILAEAQGKFRRVSELAPTVAMSGRALVFAETVKAVDRALASLRDAKLAVASIDGETDIAERTAILRDFTSGRIKALAAPRILDEGIDVPEADVAIIVAGTSSRRQLIQRLGRVIRRKQDGRAARVYVLFVAGSPEDPESKHREEVVAELMRHAQTTRIMGLGEAVD